MAFYVGNNGSIVVAPETTYGTAPASGYDTLFGISSSLGLKRTLLEANYLTIDPVNVTDYAPLFVDGEITCNWSEEADVMDELLKSFFAGGGASPYTMDSAPANTSITAVNAFSSSLGYVYTGLVANSFSIDIKANEFPVVAMGFIGRGCAKDVSPATGDPDISNIAAPSEFTTVTVDGTTLGCKSVTVSGTREYTGGDRSVVGAGSISQPVESGRKTISASMTVDMSDDTDFNSIEQFDNYLAGTSLGEVVVGSGNSEITLSNCRMTGDIPSLGSGLVEFPINVEATAISIAALA